MSINGAFISEQSSFNGNITATHITVEGEVVGDLRANSEVLIKSNGRVDGDIYAPKILLEKGCDHSGTMYLDDSTPKISLNQESPEPKEESEEDKQPTKEKLVTSDISPKKKNKLW